MSLSTFQAETDCEWDVSEALASELTMAMLLARPPSDHVDGGEVASVEFEIWRVMSAVQALTPSPLLADFAEGVRRLSACGEKAKGMVCERGDEDGVGLCWDAYGDTEAARSEL